MNLDTHMTTTLREPRKITGLHVLLILLGFFVTVTAVNVLMMWSAITTFGGLETEDAYRKGLAYNQTIKADEAQAALGWSAAVTATPGGTTLHVNVTDRNNAAVSNLGLSGEIGRPATNRFDEALSFRETAPGQYEASPGKALAPGLWIAHLSAVKAQPERTDNVFEARQRLWIAP